MATTGKHTQRVTGLRRAGALALLLAITGGAIELHAQWRAGRSVDQVAVGYRVEVLDAAAGILGVEMALGGLDGGALWVGAAPTAVLPEATVGRFRLREATGPAGEPLEIRRDPPHWQLRGAGGAATLRYEVHLARGAGGSEFAAEALSQLDAGGGACSGPTSSCCPWAPPPTPSACTMPCRPAGRWCTPSPTGRPPRSCRG